MKDQPDLEQRLVFVQYVRRQRCRYNPSFDRFLRLPPTFQSEIAATWKKRNPKAKLPEFKVSKPEKK